MTVKAHEVLEAGVKHMQDRAATYDKPDGERSMEATVNAFNVITGDGLMNTEERGWLFMNILKMVRSQQGDFKLDNYEDGAAYWGLAAEAAHKERVTIDWPTDDRIETIGQNGNDGAVYKKYRDLEKPETWKVGDYAIMEWQSHAIKGEIIEISENSYGDLCFTVDSDNMTYAYSCATSVEARS